MSTISLHNQDFSEALCRRFAIMTTEFLEAPPVARTDAALVPLENMFRVLQMFRYESFADERRSGILALQEHNEYSSVRFDEEEWHVRIEAALRAALETTFQGISRDDAINEIQATLRWLATSTSEPSEAARQRSKVFFQSLTVDLK